MFTLIGHPVQRVGGFNKTKDNMSRVDRASCNDAHLSNKIDVPAVFIAELGFYRDSKNGVLFFCTVLYGLLSMRY